MRIHNQGKNCSNRTEKHHWLACVRHSLLDVVYRAESSCCWGADIRHPGPHPNFRRLVLGCIDADLCNQRLILKSSPRSTKYTLSWISQISKFHLKFSIFPVIFSGFWFKIAFFIEKCIFLFEKVHFQYIFAKENALFKPWMCPPAATGLL